MVKILSRLSLAQRYVLGCIAFLWLSAAICGTATACALVAFLTAVILGIAGAMTASSSRGRY